jgi:hypothetical protein
LVSFVVFGRDPDGRFAVERAQAADSLRDRRVCHQQRRDPGARQRVDGVERGGRGVDGHRQGLGAPLEALERVRERRASAEDLRAGGAARYSRWRETASCSSIAASGAKTIVAIIPMRPSAPPSSSSPPNRNENCRMFAIAEIAPATMAAMEETRMSRFLMCANSCASTPLI